MALNTMSKLLSSPEQVLKPADIDALPFWPRFLQTSRPREIRVHDSKPPVIIMTDGAEEEYVGVGAVVMHPGESSCLCLRGQRQRQRILQSHSGVKVFVEQEVPALTRAVNGRTEHARMDLAICLDGSVTYLDVSIVAPFSCSPSLVSAASTKPGLMAKRAEKTEFDRYPHIDLVPFILDTTGRPGPHARKFISYLLRDADNPPLAIRDTWSTIQSVLHSAISKQQLTAAVT